jgi:hypothetical protein
MWLLALLLSKPEVGSARSITVARLVVSRSILTALSTGSMRVTAVTAMTYVDLAKI